MSIERDNPLFFPKNQPETSFEKCRNAFFRLPVFVANFFNEVRVLINHHRKRAVGESRHFSIFLTREPLTVFYRKGAGRG